MAEEKELKNIPKYKHLYFFEVQTFTDERNFVHTGYMNRLFASKQDAALYFQRYMPRLILLKGVSNWNANKIRYKLHKYYSEKLNYAPFDAADPKGIWVPHPYSPIGTTVELGKAMQKGPGEPMAEFPLCSGRECWCYDCAMNTTEPEDLYDLDYDEQDHRLRALRHAKHLLIQYTKSLTGK
jgi:hypothetical protein